MSWLYFGFFAGGAASLLGEVSLLREVCCNEVDDNLEDELEATGGSVSQDW